MSLQLQNLVVARGGRPVVRDISLDIPPGEVTALLGPNGAGKSTLVLAVGGVLPTVSGTVRLTTPSSPHDAQSASAVRAWRSSRKDGVCCPT